MNPSCKKTTNEYKFSVVDPTMNLLNMSRSFDVGFPPLSILIVTYHTLSGIHFVRLLQT